MRPEAEIKLLRDARYTSLLRVSSDLVQRRRKISSLGPIEFGWVYFPEIMMCKTPDFHREIADAFMNFNRFAVAAPVGSAKTTVLTVLGSMWSVFFEHMNNAEHEVLVVANSGELAGKWLDKIGNLCKRSTALKEDFGDFIGQHWGSGELEFKFPDRRALITGLGKGAALRGRRPNRLIVDDPEDEASLKSELQRRDFYDWFWGALVNRLDDPTKKLTYIGTCVSPDAFLTSLINKPADGWVCRHYGMLDEATNTSLWEEKWPLDLLRQRRQEIGEEKFQQEFQNNPVRLFAHKLFKEYSEKERTPEKEDAIFIAFDPAFAPGADSWAYVVVEVDKEARWHVREAHKENTGFRAMMDRMLLLRKKYPRVRKWGIETAGTQTVVKYNIEDVERANHVSFDMEYIKHARNSGSKSARIAVLARILNSGRVTFQPGLELMRREVMGYIGGKDKQEDHLLDALEMVQVISEARKPFEAKVETEAQRVHRNYNAITYWKTKYAPKKGGSIGWRF